MDNVGTIIKMQENNLSNYEQHKNAKSLETDKFQNTKKSYDYILNNENIDDKIKQKYYLEYAFLFEQYSQKILSLDSLIKRSEMYSKRLEKILDYVEITNSSDSSYSALRSKLYQINSIVINEAVCYYDGLIEKYKQDKLLNTKFLEYINYLKMINDDIEKYQVVMPTSEQLENINSNIEYAIKEKDILIEVFRNEKFNFVEDTDIMSLSQADIPDVLEIMYPCFKEKLNEIDTMKGKKAA